MTGLLFISHQKRGGIMEKICKHLQFLKSDDEKRYTLGIVYEPDTVDSQGDYATAEDIEKAAWDFMRKTLTLGYMHKVWDKQIGEIVESYVAPVDITGRRCGRGRLRASRWAAGRGGYRMLEMEKHLPGRHDQKTHGRRGPRGCCMN